MICSRVSYYGWLFLIFSKTMNGRLLTTVVFKKIFAIIAPRTLSYLNSFCKETFCECSDLCISVIPLLVVKLLTSINRSKDR